MISWFGFKSSTLVFDTMNNNNNNNNDIPSIMEVLEYE